MTPQTRGDTPQDDLPPRPTREGTPQGRPQQCLNDQERVRLLDALAVALLIVSIVAVYLVLHPPS